MNAFCHCRRNKNSSEVIMTVKRVRVLDLNGSFAELTRDYNTYRDSCRLPTRRAGQPAGFKSEAKLIVLRKFEYRLELNNSKSSRFPIPMDL